MNGVKSYRCKVTPVSTDHWGRHLKSEPETPLGPYGFCLNHWWRSRREL